MFSPRSPGHIPIALAGERDPDTGKLIERTHALMKSLRAAALGPFLADWPLANELRPVVPSALPVLRWLPDVKANAPALTLELVNEMCRAATMMSWRRTYTAAEIGAAAGNLEKKKLLETARSSAVEKRIRASTAEFHAMQITQRPSFVIETEIGDRAIFSGVVKFEPLAATLDSMLDDATAYAAHKAHFGNPPPK